MTSATLVPTSSQTVGPFVEIGCKYLGTNRVAAPGPGALDVAIRGRVIDGDGKLVPDYMLEIWQITPSATPNASSVIDGASSGTLGTASVILGAPSNVLGAPSVILSEAKDLAPSTTVAFARVMPLADASFDFHTAYSQSLAGDSAPHLAMLVFMRGLLKPLLTRMYFPADPRNDADALLALVPPDRRATLIAFRKSQTADSLALEWNIVLQGPAETVFFEW